MDQGKDERTETIIIYRRASAGRVRPHQKLTATTAISNNDGTSGMYMVRIWTSNKSLSLSAFYMLRRWITYNGRL